MWSSWSWTIGHRDLCLDVNSWRRWQFHASVCGHWWISIWKYYWEEKEPTVQALGLRHLKGLTSTGIRANAKLTIEPGVEIKAFFYVSVFLPFCLCVCACVRKLECRRSRDKWLSMDSYWGGPRCACVFVQGVFVPIAGVGWQFQILHVLVPDTGEGAQGSYWVDCVSKHSCWGIQVILMCIYFLATVFHPDQTVKGTG